MSSLLPQYSKLATSDPAAFSDSPYAATPAVSTSTPSSFVLPSAFCDFHLVSSVYRSVVDNGASTSGISPRGNSKAETLSLVSAAFPKANLAARDPATIIFAVPSGNGFSRVDDRFWDQVVIQGKPDRMQVTVRLSFRERIIDVLKVLSLVVGPVLAFFFVIAVCVLLFGK